MKFILGRPHSQVDNFILPSLLISLYCYRNLHSLPEDLLVRLYTRNANYSYWKLSTGTDHNSKSPGLGSGRYEAVYLTSFEILTTLLMKIQVSCVSASYLRSLFLAHPVPSLLTCYLGVLLTSHSI